jgi:hypothetical protein
MQYARMPKYATQHTRVCTSRTRRAFRVFLTHSRCAHVPRELLMHQDARITHNESCIADIDAHNAHDAHNTDAALHAHDAHDA